MCPGKTVVTGFNKQNLSCKSGTKFPENDAKMLKCISWSYIPEMGQFRFRNRNWNQNRPLFKLDVIGIGIESTLNFSVGIGIGIGIDPAWNWNRNRSIPAL